MRRASERYNTVVMITLAKEIRKITSLSSVKLTQELALIYKQRERLAIKKLNSLPKIIAFTPE